MPRERLTRTILLEETKPFSATVETLDLHELGAAFSALFDQTAQLVFRQGLDLDDVIVERLLDCRRKDGATVRVPLPSLRYTDYSGREFELGDASRQPRLCLTWASWCAICGSELADLCENQQQLRRPGIEIHALSVNGPGRKTVQLMKAKTASYLLLWPITRGKPLRIKLRTDR